MSSTEAVPQRPKVRHKSFSYRTALDHTSGRSADLAAEGLPVLHVSSPPEFKGEPGLWTPEHLFVAAVDVCTMTTFLAFADRRKLDVTAYRSEAEGVLEFVDGGYRFTRVTLRPRIRVASAADAEAAERVLREAHEACLIGRSVVAEVRVEPGFEVAETKA